MIEKFSLQAEKEPNLHPIYESIKSWIEKRISLRRQVNAPVLVLQGTQVRSGQLLDISERGFGLEKVAGLVEDELISIATHDGLILEGRVVWVNGGRAGVALISNS